MTGVYGMNGMTGRIERRAQHLQCTIRDSQKWMSTFCWSTRPDLNIADLILELVFFLLSVVLCIILANGERHCSALVSIVALRKTVKIRSLNEF